MRQSLAITADLGAIHQQTQPLIVIISDCKGITVGSGLIAPAAYPTELH